MSTASDLKPIIETYCTRHSSGVITYNQIVSFIDRYIMENPEKEKQLEDLLRMSGKYLLVHLDTLEKEGWLKIQRTSEGVNSVVILKYFIKTIEDSYQRLDDKPELPFPTEDSLRLVIPPEEVKAIEIKNDFMQWLNKDDEDTYILRISFPDGIQSLITSSHTLNGRMLAGAVHKIRHYLRDSKNLAYMRQRLTPLFRGREIAVKDMLHTIVTSPEQSVQSIIEPSDFTFQLWTQLSTNLVKEYGPKSDKLAEEHGFCQAAYLIGYYNMFHRSKVQRRKEEETSLGFLIQNMRKPPFAYKISQIYEFTDDKGLLLVKRCDKEKINAFITEKTKAPSGKDIPEILTFTTRSKEEFYILYTSVAQYLSENLLRAQKEMRDFYKRSWQIALRSSVEFTTMHKDEEFRAHVEQRLRVHYPALEALLVFPVVYLSSRIDGLPAQARIDLNDTIIPNAQKLKSLEVIMKLARKRMLEDAKIMLPAWMVIPVVREVVHFMRNLFLGKEMAEQSIAMGFDHEGQTRFQRATKKKASTEIVIENQENSTAKKAGPQAFRAAAKDLDKAFLSADEDLAGTLLRYHDRWNQILDPKAKADLTADINGLCRDYLRKQRAFASASPPAADMIRTWAAKLVESELLSGIRNKKDLLRYVELYFLTLLQTAS